MEKITILQLRNREVNLVFNYDSAMSDTESHVFVNVSQNTDKDSPDNLEGWGDDGEKINNRNDSLRMA